MATNPFDQASRYAAKLDAAGHLAWLLRLAPAALPFRGWLDTRTLPFPGDPERTCDTVAWLGAAPDVDWAVAYLVATGPSRPSLTPLLYTAGLLLVVVGCVSASRPRLPESSA